MLGRIKTWIDGETLFSVDLNGEINNILNNPVSLISPSTGAIDFGAQAHTNLRLQNVATTPTPSSTGLVYYNTAARQVQVDDGSAIRMIPTAGQPVTTTMFTLSTEWGATVAISAASGTDMAYRFTVATSGGGQAGNPTVTFTPPAGWPRTPLGITALTGGTGINSTGVAFTISRTETSSAQQMQMIMGNPDNAVTYIFTTHNL
jgi:hypothetical protein